MNDSEGEFIYTHEFSPTVNWEEPRDHAVAAAKKVFGEENVDGNVPPMMVSEDFGAFIEDVPGCFVFIGNGVEEQGKGFYHSIMPVMISMMIFLKTVPVTLRNWPAAD